MKFSIISLFPDFFTSPLKESLLSKAISKKIIEVEVHNLRSFSSEPRQSVDDSPYGGGAGMILKADVLSKAVKSTKTQNSLIILTDPAGQKFDQKLAQKLAKKTELILIAGRYEGVDQRFKDKYVDLELSIGDYVLNGGEAAVLVILETIARLLPGVVGKEESLALESFGDWSAGGQQTLLEYPQYTRPTEFEGMKVPKVLISGDHQKIQDWRIEQALEKTKKLRPDLLK